MDGNISLIVDAAVGVLVVISAYLAMVRGFVREMFALGSWIIAFFAALFLAPFVKPLLVSLPTVGDMLKDGCEMLALVSFIIVFGVALIVTGLVFYMLSGPTNNTTASVLDQGLGFMYGALRGLVLVAVVYIAYVRIVPAPDAPAPTPDAVQEALVERTPLREIGPNDAIAGVYSERFVRPVAEFIWARTPADMPDFLKRRAEELTGNCEN